jgi:hypothetical protein
MMDPGAVSRTNALMRFAPDGKIVEGEAFYGAAASGGLSAPASSIA